MEYNAGIAATAESNWNSRSIGSELQYGIFHLLIRVGGRRAAYALLYVVALWYVTFYPGIRRKAGHYVDRRFPGCRGLARLRHMYRLCLMLGKVLIDRAIIRLLGECQIDVSFEDKRTVLDLLKRGKGLIVVNSHVGCWQAAVPTLNFLDTPVNMLMYKQDGEREGLDFEKDGREHPFRIIDPRGYLGGALEMVGVLQQNQVLSLMGDRVFGNPKNSHEVSFLGAPAAFPISAFKLAAATGTPCLILFSHKSGQDSYVLELAEVMELDAGSDDTRPKIETAVARYAQLLEEYCGNHPYQFFNFFDMWADPAASMHTTKSTSE